jgi:hypothetical protein
LEKDCDWRKSAARFQPVIAIRPDRLTRYAAHSLFCSSPIQSSSVLQPTSGFEAAARITRPCAPNKLYRHDSRNRFSRLAEIRKMRLDSQGNSSAKRVSVQMYFFGIFREISPARSPTTQAILAPSTAKP